MPCIELESFVKLCGGLVVLIIDPAMDAKKFMVRIGTLARRKFTVQSRVKGSLP